MKTQYGALGLSIILAGVCIWLSVRLNSVSASLAELQKSVAADSTAGETEAHEDIEVAVIMGRIQLYAHKLWFAGNAQNWPLADFYTHELEEAMEEIADEPLLAEDGILLAPLMESWGLGAVEALEKTIDQKDVQAFTLQYDNLIVSCNGCHTAVKHDFIKIKRPVQPAIDNQVFTTTP